MCQHNWSTAPPSKIAGPHHHAGIALLDRVVRHSRSPPQNSLGAVVHRPIANHSAEGSTAPPAEPSYAPSDSPAIFATAFKRLYSSRTFTAPGESGFARYSSSFIGSDSSSWIARSSATKDSVDC